MIQAKEETKEISCIARAHGGRYTPYSGTSDSESRRTANDAMLRFLNVSATDWSIFVIDTAIDAN